MQCKVVLVTLTKINKSDLSLWRVRGAGPLALCCPSLLPLLSLSDQLWRSREKNASESPSCWREEDRRWLGGEGRARPEEQPAPRIWAALTGHTQPQVVECAQPRTRPGPSGVVEVVAAEQTLSLCVRSVSGHLPAAVLQQCPWSTAWWGSCQGPPTPQPLRQWWLLRGVGGSAWGEEATLVQVRESCWVTRTAGTGGWRMRLVLRGELGG